MNPRPLDALLDILAEHPALTVLEQMAVVTMLEPLRRARWHVRPFARRLCVAMADPGRPLEYLTVSRHLAAALPRAWAAPDEPVPLGVGASRVRPRKTELEHALRQAGFRALAGAVADSRIVAGPAGADLIYEPSGRPLLVEVRGVALPEHFDVIGA